MRTVSRVFSIIGGIIATIIGLVSIVGIVVSIIFAGFTTELIKPIIICVLFFTCAIGMLTKGRGVVKLIMLVLMLVVLIIEQFVWIGSIFVFTEAALALIPVAEVSLIFAQYYSIIMYVLLAFTFIATIFHIIAMALKK